MAQTATQEDVTKRQTEIENDLVKLFESSLKVTDWNVPEADDKTAAQMICDILQAKLDGIKSDVANGKYDYY